MSTRPTPPQATPETERCCEAAYRASLAADENLGELRERQAMDLAELARQLERSRDQAVELLLIIAALDDGDNPALWRADIDAAFEKVRAFLARMKKGKRA